MAQADTRKLDTGDPFPDIRLNLVDGNALSLPTTAKEGWTVFFSLPRSLVTFLPSAVG